MKSASGSLVPIVFLVVSVATSCGQEPVPGTIPWTPVDDGNLVKTTIEVPLKYVALNLNPDVHFLYLPPGWTAKIYHAGNTLNKPRFMAWGPDSVLFVANMNARNVLALPDKDGDGVADEVIVAASGFSTGHDVRFYRDTMYVSQVTGLTKLWRSTGTGYEFDQRVTLVDKASQPNQTGGNHTTRTLGLDTNNFKLYISVGSRGNADRETDRGLIEMYDWDGSGRRTIATGIRNAVGLTIHPRTGRLWANNNGSDMQGNDVPPEWVDLVRDNGFYGYPYAYHYQRWFDFNVSDYKDILPITVSDSAKVASMVPAAALVAAHSAPMAIEFAPATMPAPFQNGCFMVMRGSWNRSPVSGSKVIFLEFDNDSDTVANMARDFCTGFLPDSNNVASRWARPVGLAIAADGSVYVSTDDQSLKQFIIKLSPPSTTSVPEERGNGSLDFNVMPNPSNERLSVSVANTVTDAILTMATIQGQTILRKSLLKQYEDVDTARMSTGTYIIRIDDGKRSGQRLISIIH
jgi:glucose/arabinose dehydrogenase